MATKAKAAAAAPATADAAAGETKINEQSTQASQVSEVELASTTESVVVDAGVAQETSTVADQALAVQGEGSASDPVLEAEKLSAADAAGDAVADATDELVTPSYPQLLTVLNNSAVALFEPISGVYAQAGGGSTVTLQDEVHADEFWSALRVWSEQNFIPLDKLVITPA